MRPRVLYLYNERSKSDARLCESLEKWLYALYRDDRQTTRWHVPKAGSDVQLEREQRLQEADVILPLLTPDFVGDDHCHASILAAMAERERGAVVVPILLRPVPDLSTLPLAGLQLLPRNGVPVSKWRNKDDAWQVISGEIRSVLETATLRSSKALRRAPGTIAGQYQLTSLLASSGNSDIYVGQHSIISRRSAIKIPKKHVDSAYALETMRHEAQALDAAVHPGVVALHDAGLLPDGTPYIAMELVDGAPLSRAAFSSAPAPPSWTRVLSTLARIAETVAELHSRGIIHCDLKPTNILIAREESARRRRFDPTIIDFGAAHLGNSLPAQEEQRRFFGTPAYMSPEQATDPGAMDEKTDVFTFGIVLFELFAGRLPFRGGSLAEILQQRTCGSAPAMATVEPCINPLLQRLVDSMLSRRPQDRPTMRQVAVDLRLSLEASDSSLMPSIIEEFADAGLLSCTISRSLPFVEVDTQPVA